MPTDSLMIEKTHCLPFHRELLSPQLLRSGLVDPGRGEAGGERESGGGEEKKIGFSAANTSGESMSLDPIFIRLRAIFQPVMTPGMLEVMRL